MIFIISHRHQLNQYNYLYCSSDFLPDSIPGLLFKLLSPKTKLISSFFLFAPSPFSKTNPYKSSFRIFVIGILYWLIQKITFPLISIFSDFVFVTSEPDRTIFNHFSSNRSKVITVRGGVEYIPTQKKISSLKPSTNRKFAAVFIGRLHHQKGILKLIDIWQLVVAKYPSAKLAVIGNGPLESEINIKIHKNDLSRNIKLLGFLSGTAKYQIFQQSQMVLHPATYDSGGMAAAEAMAWGLPGISFDLESLKTYYPKGVIKITCFNNQEFADSIIQLLSNIILYNKLSIEARQLIQKHWSWPKRANYIYSQIIK